MLGSRNDNPPPASPTPKPSSALPGPSPAPTLAPTAPPKPKPVAQETILLDLHKSAKASGDNVTLSFSPVGSDKARFEVQVNSLGWIGFGISTGTTGLMIGGGLGTDAVVCSNGQVKRYWLRSYSGLGKDFSDDIESASCKQANGYTTLTFVRNIAWGDDEDTAKFHGGKHGMQKVDFGQEDSFISGASAHDVIFILGLFIMLISV